ncbi:electron transporter RnfD [Lachnospiraceae bacterium ZAX-1]
MLVALDSQEIIYSGRIDTTDAQKPEFIFPASSMRVRFFGKSAHVLLKNKQAYWKNSVGAIIDGEQKKWDINDEGLTEVRLLEEEQDANHEILLFKRQDSCHTFTIETFTLSKGARLLPIDDIPNRRIEVYGDSISAGEVSEAVDYVGQPDPEHEGEYSNSWYSYAWMAARKLNAQIHDIAQGGIGLLNGTGWVFPPVYPGMEFMWDKVHYHPQLGKVTDWDFSKYTPHIVIVAIGQNDNHPQDYMKESLYGEKAKHWKKKYQAFLCGLRSKYPTALIILTTTILEHDANWDTAIEEACQEMKDERIRHFLYSRNGRGTKGHIRIPEAEEMSDELVAYIENLTLPIWEV